MGAHLPDDSSPVRSYIETRREPQPADQHDVRSIAIATIKVGKRLRPLGDITALVESIRDVVARMLTPEDEGVAARYGVGGQPASADEAVQVSTRDVGACCPESREW